VHVRCSVAANTIDPICQVTLRTSVVSFPHHLIFTFLLANRSPPTTSARSKRHAWAARNTQFVPLQWEMRKTYVSRH